MYARVCALARARAFCNCCCKQLYSVFYTVGVRKADEDKRQKIMEHYSEKRSETTELYRGIVLV